MGASTRTRSSRAKVQAQRDRLRRQGLRSVYRLMVDKITTVPKSRIGARIGRLADEDVVRLSRAVAVFLGIGGAPVPE